MIKVPLKQRGAFIFANLRCRKLEEITVPSSVESIGQNAFEEVRKVIYSGSATGSPWGAFNTSGSAE